MWIASLMVAGSPTKLKIVSSKSGKRFGCEIWNVKNNKYNILLFASKCNYHSKKAAQEAGKRTVAAIKHYIDNIKNARQQSPG